MESGKCRMLILGAAGRDFHYFNTRCRDDSSVEVVAFTATQIPDIDGRRYPTELAGKLYPEGIPIVEEKKLEGLIVRKNIDRVVFAYSDVSHEYVMHLASRVVGVGADFIIPNAPASMIESKLPVIAVTATRTGAGKSQTSRAVAQVLGELGLRVGVIRHPMPYGDLVKQRVQRFATYADLDTHECTIEEREEYEPHIDAGSVVFAGVDYADILAAAEEEADVILWDGGNNDTPFYEPDLWICVTDPHRSGHGASYHPGEINLRGADVIIINKTDSAEVEDVQKVEAVIAELNPAAIVIKAESPYSLEGDIDPTGKRALVIEDGPTVTHGGMQFGAGLLAAKAAGVAEVVDPRPFAVGGLKQAFTAYPHLEDVLPALGYGEQQVQDLNTTVNNADCDVVISGTPIDIGKLLKIDIPLLRVRYDLDVESVKVLGEIIEKRIST
jgi:predicted GTPase